MTAIYQGVEEKMSRNSRKIIIFLDSSGKAGTEVNARYHGLDEQCPETPGKSKILVLLKRDRHQQVTAGCERQVE